MCIFQVVISPLVAAIAVSQRVRAEASVSGDDGSLSCSLDDACSSGNDVVEGTTAAANNGSFKISPTSSITDFLDPELLDGEEVLTDIKSNMLAGNLVVIHDAFVPDFAEFVWLKR